MSEWISVKDRLPDSGERVLVDFEGFVGEGYLTKSGFFARYKPEGMPILIMGANHWMPMPEPPGKDGE